MRILKDVSLWYFDQIKEYGYGISLCVLWNLFLLSDKTFRKAVSGQMVFIGELSLLYTHLYPLLEEKKVTLEKRSPWTIWKLTLRSSLTWYLDVVRNGLKNAGTFPSASVIKKCLICYLKVLIFCFTHRVLSKYRWPLL